MRVFTKERNCKVHLHKLAKIIKVFAKQSYKQRSIHYAKSINNLLENNNRPQLIDLASS
jgi:uncharacterized membrane-anchored protein YhcB (DUF1043 family)